MVVKHLLSSDLGSRSQHRNEPEEAAALQVVRAPVN